MGCYWKFVVEDIGHIVEQGDFKRMVAKKAFIQGRKI